MKKILTSPQVIAAIITGTITIAVAVLPGILDNSEPAIPTQAPTSTPIATQSPEPTALPTQTPTPLPVIEPTSPSTPIPAPTVTVAPTNPPPANILLIYDDVSFTVYNQSSQPLSLDTMRFQSANGRWEARNWGPGLAASLPADNCLRMRDITSSERQPPSICGNLWGFQLVGSSALFWLGVDTFEVIHDETLIATCQTASDSCPISVP